MEKLFPEFPPVSTEKWIETIKKDLKTDSLEKLMRKTIDGLIFEPFYRKNNTENLEITNAVPANFPFIRGYNSDNEWLIRHNFSIDNNIASVKNKVKKALDRNANIIGFDFGKKFDFDKNSLLELIEGIENIALSAHQNIENAFDFINETNVKNAYLNFDPLTFDAFTGNNSFAEKKNILLKFLGNNAENITPIGINISHFANAGASHSQQLAIALAVTSEYLDLATENNIPVEKVLKNISFNFATGTEFFMEIAKIRSFRFLFAKLVESFDENLKNSAQTFIHCTTLRRNKTIYDPYVNMLRTTIEALASVTAGTNALSIEPFDTVFGKPDDFSDRIAINQQLILKEEAFLNKITDPAGGSYYIENLSVKLIGNAWQIFIEIENQGGFYKALNNNFIFELIEKTAKKEQELVDKGRITILGTNKFPNRTEKIKNQNFSKPAEISDSAIPNPKFKPVKIARLAEKFENLRLSVEKSEKIPSVFLLTYGNAAMRRARADFAGNFFATAGFEIIDNLGFDNLDKACADAENSNADIVVLCSSDDNYLEMAKKTALSIKNKILVIAGNPDNADEIKKLGDFHFIHIKSNIYDDLQKFAKLLNLTF